MEEETDEIFVLDVSKTPKSTIIGDLHCSPTKKDSVEVVSLPKEAPQKGNQNNFSVDKLNKIWAEVDINGDNELDFGELRTVFMKMGENLSDSDLKMVMREIDVDGSGTVSKGELTSLMCRKPSLNYDSVCESFKFFSGEDNLVSISNLESILVQLSDSLSKQDIKDFVSKMKESALDGERLDYQNFVQKHLKKEKNSLTELNM